MTRPTLLALASWLVSAVALGCSSRDRVPDPLGTARQALEAGTNGATYTSFTQQAYLSGARQTIPSTPGCSDSPGASTTPPSPASVSCDGGTASVSLTLKTDGFDVDGTLNSPKYQDTYGGNHRANSGIGEALTFNVAVPGQLTFQLTPSWGDCQELDFTDPRMANGFTQIVLSSTCDPGYAAALSSTIQSRVVVATDSWSVTANPGADLTISWVATNFDDSIAPGGQLNGDGSGHALTVKLVTCNNDGVRDPGESCDGKDLGGASCTSLGFSGGTLACAPGCAFDLSGCTIALDGGTDAGSAGNGGSAGAGGSSTGGSSTGGSSTGGTPSTGGSSTGGGGGTTASGGAGGAPGSAGAGTAGTGASDAGSQCSQAPDPLLSTVAPSFTLPTFKKGFTVRGLGFDVELGGKIATKGGTADAPCHAGISANADFTSCVHAVGSDSCDGISLGVAGGCDFASTCTSPPKESCDLGTPTCCTGSVDASYTKTLPVPGSKLQLGPVSCDTKLEFQVGSTISLERQWGSCECAAGTFTASGSVFARDQAGFNGCTATLFGKTISFDPVDVDAAACVSLGLSGTEGCGSSFGPIGSAGVKFGIKTDYKIGFFEFDPWELVSGGGVDASGNLTDAVTCF